MKFEKIQNTKNVRVLTPTGYQEFSGMRRRKNWLWKVDLQSGNSLEVTEDHPFSIVDKEGEDITACLSELYIGDRLQTKTGMDTITSIASTGKYDWTYDLLDVNGAVYYANDILSHNCFIESGRSAVDGELLNQFREHVRPPDITMMDGFYKIWQEPKPNHLYAVGVDVGEGIGQAASVAQIFDITDLAQIEQVAIYHNDKIDPYHFANVLNDIAHHWGKPWLGIERNNCGGTVIDTLTEVHQYHNIIDHTPDNQSGYSRLGIYCHTNSKFDGVMNMRYWINSLRCVAINDIATLHEMETFVRYPNGTWKKQRGDYIYDDRVMAMIWCLIVLMPTLVERYFEVAEWDENGKPKKIHPFTIEKPEYFKLDSFYQETGNAPLPAFFGLDQDGGEDDIVELQKLGWKFPDR